jgi:stromal membrane-associated protein
MGTHISKVKSVDLDSWTDEQLQSVLIWGNARANKYWEAKLAPGHVPSEAKIENFIRTKYEAKRWVMEGPIPDPSTLDADGDDDVPLNLVKEKHNIERSGSERTSAAQPTGPSSVRRVQQPDLFGDDDAPPQRASSAVPAVAIPTPKAEAAPPKQTKPADSLLGLDFFGAATPPPNRPASAAATAGTAGQSRPDLKQSILSLYASAPRPQPQQPQHSSQGSFGGMQSAPVQQQQQQQQTSFGGLNDAFSGLNFSNTTSPSLPQTQSVKPNAFAGLGNISSHRSTSQVISPQSSNFGGGSFFDTKPTVTSAHHSQASRTFNSSSDFSAFGSAMSPVTTAQPASSSGLGDLFDFGAASPAAPAPKQTIASPPPQSSVFNLSTPQPAPITQPVASTMSGWNNNDAWGSNDAWSTPDTQSTKLNTPIKAPPAQTSTNDFGWGSGGSLANQSIVPGGGGGFNTASSVSKPQVAADDDFGGWSSAAPVTPGAGKSQTSSGKPASGFGASEDLFSNVWE